MATVEENLVTKGLKGSLGKTVYFRQWGGKTILCDMPVRNKKLPIDEDHKRRMSRFREATDYAKQVMNDQELKQAYKRKCTGRQHAFSKAIQDYLTSPVIHEIDLSTYTGEIDSFIRINATDTFRVKQVQVRIEDQGIVIETGFAQQEGDTDWWRFIATAPYFTWGNGKVIVSACDLPGNETTKEAPLRSEV